VNSKIIFNINCVDNYASDVYFENKETVIVNSPLGSYRETSDTPLSRFGYRFKVENTDKMYKLTMYYPDDKRRYLCVLNSTTYELTTGAITGMAYEPTNKLIKIVLYFYPRFKDNSIVFMNWGKDEPAAVASFKIEELDEIPVAKPIVNNRTFGVEYEDPCGVCSAEGANSRLEWSVRVAQHLHMCGMNHITYPINWYHGPFYPSDIENSHYFELIATENRDLYARWIKKPYDWVSEFLEELNKYSINFQGSLSLIRLSSLMEKINDTNILNATSVNQYQRGTKDWTITYNTENFQKMADVYGEEGTEPFALTEEFGFAYDEKTSGDYNAGPIFNPLYPTVQEAILNLVSEIVDKYSKHSNFKGISLNMWHSSFFWFGSLHSGYDDYTINLFEKETGIKMPVDSEDSERFSKRYEYLTFNAKNAWINWRCKKIFDLMIKIKDIVKAKRADMYVTITNWVEMVIPSILGSVDTSSQLYARKSNVELFKEAGFDVNLFKNIDGIELDLQLEPNRDRGFNADPEFGMAGYDLPISKSSMYRDFDFLDKETINTYNKLDNVGIFIFNSWIEAWGKHMWSRVNENDPNIKDIDKIGGDTVDGIIKLNSYYPKDGFWWDSEFRVIPAFPSGYNYMEYFAHALGEFDAKKITSGGLILDRSHNEELQAFGRCYSPLPKKTFETIGISDPVTVRFYSDLNENYFYLVNRENYDISITLKFNEANFNAYDYKENKNVDFNKDTKIILAPFELQSYKLPKDIEIESFDIYIEDSKKENYKIKAENALSRLQIASEKNIYLPGAEIISGEIILALEKGRYAYLRHLLNSYVIKYVIGETNC